MFEKRFYYLVKFQFLGYRYHGWQKQPDVKTLHSVIDRTLKYILEDRKFKTLSASRTDAKVSAVRPVFELFLIDKPLEDFGHLSKNSIKIYHRTLEYYPLNKSIQILMLLKIQNLKNTIMFFQKGRSATLLLFTHFNNHPRSFRYRNDD